MKSSFEGQTVLVTGGTGSFGGTFVRHLLHSGVKEVRVLSRDEAKQDEFRRAVNDSRLQLLLGDVRAASSVMDAAEGVDFIFHAAALKQVPSCEFFPLQAVETNILGSQNVLNAADLHKVRSAVFLSTDKAVYPINAMGMTKALMEKHVLAFARSKSLTETVVSIVRYGNVMFSRGSVIPLFLSQLLHKEPITVTNPHMTRFLMTLSESVALVEQALLTAAPGDIFVKRTRSATVGELAQALGELSRHVYEVVELGTRHGEKLFETLIGSEEMTRSECREDYFRIPLDSRSLNYEHFMERGSVLGQDPDSYTSHNAQRLDVQSLKLMLIELPEIQSWLSAM